MNDPQGPRIGNWKWNAELDSALLEMAAAAKPDREIAKALDKTPSAVENRLFKLRSQIKKANTVSL